MNYPINRSWLFLLLFVIITPLLVRAETPPSVQEPITIEQSDDTTFRLTLRQSEAVVEEVSAGGEVWQQVSLDGFDQRRVENAPALPVKEFDIALPVGATAAVAVVSAETSTLSNINPLPVPEKVLVSYDANDPDSIPEFEEIYPDASGRTVQTAAPVVELSEPFNVRDYRLVTLRVSPVQPDGADVTVYDELTVEVLFSYPDGKPATRDVRVESDAFSGLINPINAAAAQAWRTTPDLDLPPANPCLGDTAYRISVTKTGIHKIKWSDLPGFTSTSTANIKMCYDDEEIAIHVVGTGPFDGADYVLFYGESIADREARVVDSNNADFRSPDETQDTDTNIYWLTFDSSQTRKRVAPLPTSSGGTPVSSYKHTTRTETDTLYEPLIPTDDFSILADDHDHWFWQVFGFNSSADSKVTTTFNLTNRVPNTPIVASAEVWGRNQNVAHRVRLDVGGQKVGETSFTGSGVAGARRVLQASVTPTSNPGSLAAGVEALNNNVANGTHLMLLEWIALTYERSLQAQSGRLQFTQPTAGNWAYNISGFSDQTFIFDVTDAYEPRMVTLSGNNFNPVPTATDFPATYALATANGALVPANIVEDTASALRRSNSADYIIITDPSLRSALNPLISLRQSKGLTVQTVYVQDIFDEFSYGRYTPSAIRDFLEFAYINWSGTQDSAPSYVLLAGDASYDHRNVMGKNNGRNLVPVYLHSGIDKFIGEAASDNQYVAFSSTQDYGRLPSMHLGRLPASNASEMRTLVGKVVGYENASAKVNWNGSHFFVSDNAKRRSGTTCINDPAGNFFNITERLISEYASPNNLLISRLFYADCHQNDSSYPPYYESNILNFKSRFISKMEEGQGFVTYVGHAGTRRWADESIVTLTEARSVRNGDQLSIMLPMTCLEGQYHRFDLVDSNNQSVEGMSETFLKNPNGGAVASYAPTGLAVATGHDLLWEGFNEELFDNDNRIIGQAVFSAKDELPTNTYIDLYDTFILLGDPAMEIKIAESQSLYLPLIIR